jgi:hypothetical protein
MTMMMNPLTHVVVRDVTDLYSILDRHLQDQEQQKIHRSDDVIVSMEFHLRYATCANFVHVKTALAALLNHGCLDHVQQVSLQVTDPNFDWATHTSLDIVATLLSLTGLKRFVWKCARGVPIVMLERILLLAPTLECLSLDRIQFLTTPVTGLSELLLNTRNVEDGSDDTYARVPVSMTMEDFFIKLRRHQSLRYFQCLHCHIKEVEESNFQQEFLGAGDNPGAIKSLLDTWVDGMVTSLGFVRSLECIHIVAPAHDHDSSTTTTRTNDVDDESIPSTSAARQPPRMLLGLFRNSPYSDEAIQKFMEYLSQEHDYYAQEQEPSPMEKVRLWISPTYQRKDDPQLLLDVCHSLTHNTTVKDFRLRGAEAAAQRYVTPVTRAAFEELLLLPEQPSSSSHQHDRQRTENTTLISCDLMEQQGSKIDFYCRLNRLGRQELMQRLHAMTRQEWLQEIVLRFKDSDLDALFFWNRIHPVFLCL